MLLALSSWPEIDAWLKRSTTVVIPIGSNEQHGPRAARHGLAVPGNHRPRGAAARGPAGGPDVQHRDGAASSGLPGTISLRPSTFQAAILDWWTP